MQGKMIPLITVTRHGSSQLEPGETVKEKVEVKIDQTKMRMILGGQETENLKFLVISMAGTKRCGKSFLANIIISYLTYLSKVSWRLKTFLF